MPRSRLLWALAILRPCLGTPDELSLVQQRLNVHEPDPRSPMPPEFMAIQQFPFAGRPTNVSTDDLMTLVMEVLAAFRDEKLLQTVYASLDRFTEVANTMLTAVAERAGNLSLVASEQGDSSLALIRLEEFFLLFDGSTETAVWDSLAILRTLMEAIPASSIVKQWTAAALDGAGLASATKDRVKHLVANVLIRQTKTLTEPKRGFCERLQPLMANLSAAEERLSTSIIPGVVQVWSVVPAMVKLAKRFAPDVEGEVAKFANTTMTTLTILLNSGQIVLDKTIDSVKQVAESRLDCGGHKRRKRRSSDGALGRPGVGILAVAATIAGWIAAAL